MNRVMVAMLLRLYPARWRREYGDELRGILMARGTGAAEILNVVRSAMGQQLRMGEPWLVVGMPMLALNLAILLWDILNPWTYADYSASWLQRGWFWLPAVCVGCWTVLRTQGKGHSAVAAMKNSLLISWPVSVVAVLAGLGVLKIITLGPGDLPGTFSEHGLAITLYDSARRPTHLTLLFLLPFFNLPFAAMGGWVGGLLAQLWLRLEKRHE